MRITHRATTVAMFLAVPYYAYLHLSDITGTWIWMMKIIGPTSPALLGLGSYAVVVLMHTYIDAIQLGAGEILDRLDHANDIGEVAGICGLLGTIIAMVAASVHGRPELSGFLQSLTSTLVGSSISALVILVSSIMRLKLAGSSS